MLQTPMGPVHVDPTDAEMLTLVMQAAGSDMFLPADAATGHAICTRGELMRVFNTKAPTPITPNLSRPNVSAARLLTNA